MKIENLSYSYQSSSPPVLNQINLELPDSYFLTILGPSGSGKSTLLRLIAGQDLPSTGSLSTGLTPNQIMSFVFQEPRLIPWRTVSENLSLPSELSKRKVSSSNIEQALHQVNLSTETKDLYPSELSGGMKMRVSLARALLTKPDLILFDEPLAALDELNRLRLIYELAQIYHQNVCRKMIYVTHNFTEAALLGTHCLVLNKKGQTQFFKDLKKSPCKETENLENNTDLQLVIQTLRTSFSEGIS